MSIQVKICGINNAAAADAAIGAGAAYAGLVFHPRSPRNLSLDLAAMLAARMRGRIKLVALFSDRRDEEVESVVARVRPDFLQLHGGETPERMSAIRARFATPVIKAIAVAEAADVIRATQYDRADILLFDAKPASDAARAGGHGVSFDWQLLSGRTFARPWFLAGGLNAANVARAIRVSGASGVDVSSGVETAPGMKDPQMIRDFVAAACASEFAPIEAVA